MYDLFKAIQHQSELIWLYQRFEILLSEAKKVNPSRDYSENEKVINLLKDFELEYLQTIEENRIMDKKIDKLIIENNNLKVYIEKLTKESESMKEIINDYKKEF